MRCAGPGCPRHDKFPPPRCDARCRFVPIVSFGSNLSVPGRGCEGLESALSCRSPPQRCLSGAGKDVRRLGGALTRLRGFKKALWGRSGTAGLTDGIPRQKCEDSGELGASCLSLRPRKVGDRRSPSRADAASHWPPIHLLTRPADLRVRDSESRKAQTNGLDSAVL
jgi:hypothetical protein